MIHEIPDDVFRQHLDALLTASSRNQPGQYPVSWFRAEVSERGINTQIWDLQQAQHNTYGTYVPGERQPDWMKGDHWGSPDLTFGRTQHAPDGEITALPQYVAQKYDPQGSAKPQYVAQKYAPRGSANQWLAPGAEVRVATVARVCERMGGLATNFEQLTEASRRYFVGLGATALSETPGAEGFRASRLGAATMNRSLELAAATESYADSGAYLDLLRNLSSDIPIERSFKNSAMVLLNDLVLGGGFFGRQPPQMSGELIAEIINKADVHGVVGNSWWVGTALLGGGVLRVPELLEMAHEKITGEGGAEAVADFPGDVSQSSIEMYITNLLDTTITNDVPVTRHLRLKDIRSRISKDKGAVVDLKKLIDEANSIAIAYNPHVGVERRLPELDPNDFRSVGDALLRVLAVSRQPELPAPERVAQFEHDILHVEIVDTLHRLLRGHRTRAIVEDINQLHARYPGSTTEELADMMGQLNDGKTPREVRAYWRTRHHAASQRVRAFGAKEPGKGLVS